MKKFVVAILVVAMVVSLCSCATLDKTIKFSVESYQVEQVEIYHLETAYDESDVRNLREENTPVCVLDGLTEQGGQKVTQLMEEISSLHFVVGVVFFPVPVDWTYIYEGYVVCVVYANGYDIVAQQGQFYYSVDFKGDAHYKYGHADYEGEAEWSSIIGKYVQNVG